MNSLSSLINYQLPQFIVEDHQLFVAFVQTYFDNLEMDENFIHFFRDFQESLNIDNASDKFVEEYYKEFCETFPISQYVDKKTIIKHIKEFYISKGSESSFKFIFTILFNSDIEIIYPRIFMQEASGGQYIQEKYFYCTANNKSAINIQTMVDASLSVYGIITGATAIIDIIDSFTYFGNDYFKIKLSSYDKDFSSEEIIKIYINDTVITEQIIDSINSIQILDGGKDYTIYDTISIRDDIGNGRNTQARITKVSKGGYNEYDIVDGGTNYAIGDIVSAIPVSNSSGHSFSGEVSAVDETTGAINGIRIFDSGYNYPRSTFALIESVNGSNAIISLTGDVGAIQAIDVIDSGYLYDTPILDINTSTGTGFDYSVIFNPIYEQPKRYINDDDWLSSTSKIQDSYYYQQFSYAIKSKISPDKWIDIIKTNIHPVGSEAFAIFLREDERDVSVILPENYKELIKIENLNYPVTSINTEIESVDLYFTTRKDFYTPISYSMGLTYFDIDQIKFWDNFDHTLNEFKNVTFNQFTFPQSRIFTHEEKQESTEITII
jgi:hypothetical protein